MYKRSVLDPAGFWSDIACEFYWKKKWGHQVFDENLDVRKGPIKIQVFFSFPIIKQNFTFLNFITFLPTLLFFWVCC